MTWRGSADERYHLVVRWTDNFGCRRRTRVVQTAKVCDVCFLYCGGGSIAIPNPNFFPELQHGVRSCPRQAPSLLPLSAAALSLTRKEGKQARRSALARRRSRCPGVDSSAREIERREWSGHIFDGFPCRAHPSSDNAHGNIKRGLSCTSPSAAAPPSPD